MTSPERRYSQWRTRNPDLASRFDKLPKTEQTRIRAAFGGPTARGVSKDVRQTAAARTERKRETDARYRHRQKVRAKVLRTIGNARPTDFVDDTEESEFWDMYDRMNLS